MATAINRRRTLNNPEESGNSGSKRRRTSLQPPRPLYKATISTLAGGDISARETASTTDVDAAIISRIKKCIDRANHPNTPEAEAKAALHIASRIMGQYNVSQAEVLAHEPPEKRRLYAGQSIVKLTRFDGDRDKQVRQQSYIAALCNAMGCFFDCKFYTTAKHSSLDVVFYGISENTTAAAIAFEMAYNLISEWARPYKGVGSKNSYCHGASDELLRVAEKERSAEVQRTRKAEMEAVANKDKEENAARLAELARLAPCPAEKPPSSTEASNQDGPYETDHLATQTYDHSDDGNGNEGKDEILGDFVKPDFDNKEDELLNISDDLDQQIETLVKQERPSSEASPRGGLQPSPPTQVKQEDLGLDLDVIPTWASCSQLVIFRETAAKIADDFLVDEGIRLSQRPKIRRVLQDGGAYRQGREDSKKIDVRRRLIAD